MNFLISLFLYFCISVFLLDFWLYLGNEKSYWRSTGVKTIRFSRAFQISKQKKIFRISVFLYFFISGHILGMKSATGYLRVSKWPDFWGLSRFPKNRTFGFLNFCISVNERDHKSCSHACEQKFLLIMPEDSLGHVKPNFFEKLEKNRPQMGLLK